MDNILLKEEICSAWGSDFLKVKNTSFPIGRVVFSFVKRDKDGKENGCIDIYLTFGQAGDLCESILSGQLFDAIRDNRTGYDSGLSGVSEEICKERNLRTDGKALSRNFTVVKSSARDYDACFMASQRPGRTDGNGIIIPCGKQELSVTVPVTGKHMREMAFCIKLAMQAYLSSLYVKEYDSFIQEYNKMYRSGALPTAAPEEKTSSQKAPAEEQKTISGTFWCCTQKGSVRLVRGTESHPATVLRLVTEKLGDDEPGVLQNSPQYQLVDVVFYENKVGDDFREAYDEVLSLFADGKNISKKLGRFVCRLGDVRDGFRQLIYFGQE